MARYTNKQQFWLRMATAAVVCALITAGLTAGWLAVRRAQRPPRTAAGAVLWPGAHWQRTAVDHPRLQVRHLVVIDLRTPGVELLLTPPDPAAAPRTFLAATTSQFARRYGVQVAVNTAFFEPFRAGTPWSYYPKAGDPADPVGLGMADGVIYSAAIPGWPALCINGVQVAIREDECPADTLHAVAGNALVLRDGAVHPDVEAHAYNSTPQPRTIVGLDATGATLWLAVVDGRQPGYSEGITLREAALWLREQGVATALNLDGGGSTTLALNGQVRNAPYHTRIPMRERPVANHFGVRFSGP